MTNFGETEEAIYIRQVQCYRRRFLYTMVHDRRDRRAAAQSYSTVSPSQLEIRPVPSDPLAPAVPLFQTLTKKATLPGLRLGGTANMATLIVLSGLPGSGKSSIARALARESGAIWLRIDSIEQALRDSGVVPGSLDDAGYRAACAVATDNLCLGHDVIGDCVNPWMLSRNAWRDAGQRAGAQVLEVEIVCSDIGEHRRRIETRAGEVPGLVLPDWQAVLARDYHPWDRRQLIIDTAGCSVAACVALLRAAMQKEGVV